MDMQYSSEKLVNLHIFQNRIITTWRHHGAVIIMSRLHNHDDIIIHKDVVVCTAAYGSCQTILWTEITCVGCESNDGVIFYEQKTQQGENV